MRKKLLILTGLLIVLAGAGYGAWRFSHWGTDIIGVTSLDKRNLVIMNSKTGKDFVNGSGKLTLADGQAIHLAYALDQGSVDVAFHAGSVSLDVFKTADLEQLSPEGETFGVSALEGKGSMDVEAPEGEYTVFFQMHDAVGNVTVSAE